MKVHTLPPDVISKIAAGEVIERPASVIKELIENALDAGTKSIELRVEQAGKTSIHLKDAGSGIEQEDIETIFLRHSTSKIAKADDLFNIRSLGFRGEALYSIAAVADITLRSKTKDAETGFAIHIRGGKKLDLRPVNMPVGTEVEVRELFFNTPARRKFLKSNITEMNQILNIFIPFCLLYPDCRFLLTHGDKTLLDLLPTDDLCERVADTLNLDRKHILETGPHERSPFPARMLLGDINIVRSRRDMQFVFINNRPVQNKSIGFHMNNIYRLILPPNHYPFFALYIEVPRDEVDVNIHPTKREVKLKNEQDLTSMLRHMCEKALMSAGQAKIGTDPIFEKVESKMGSVPLFETVSAFEEPTQPYTFPKASQSSLFSETIIHEKKDSLQNKLSCSHYIGAFMNKFLLFETGKFLLVMDQHAAQERVTFEQLIQQMEKGRVEVQHLLSPYLVKLSPQDLLMWEELKETLDSVGFSCTQFDEETVAVHTYPVLLKDPARAVQDILAGEDAARADYETLARRACRASVMAGDALNEKQAKFMRDQLIKCRDPFTCPHGRPTVIEMSEDFLDKQFLRT